MKEPLFELSSFPREGVWEALKQTSKDILIYGMGDGAAKVIHAMRSRGLICKDVFASDDFVRGQSFMGYRVKTFDQCRELYGDFIVLVAFSSALPEVIDNIKRISSLCELYIPDVNIFGDCSEVFDRAYLERNFKDLCSVYRMLSGEESRRFFYQLVLYKLSGKPDDLWKLDEYSVDHTEKIGEVKTFCDLGAYVGDTVLEWKEKSPSLRCVVAMEPEIRHFRKLCGYESLFETSVFVNAAASDCNGELSFAVGKGRGSSASTSEVIEGLRPSKRKEISCRSLDSVLEEYCVGDVDLIKYDVEGWERLAIAGSCKTIERYLPNMIVSLYHNHGDLFHIPLMLKEKFPPSCQYFLSRKKRCFPAWEVELTIIAKRWHNVQK